MKNIKVTVVQLRKAPFCLLLATPSCKPETFDATLALLRLEPLDVQHNDNAINPKDINLNSKPCSGKILRLPVNPSNASNGTLHAGQIAVVEVMNAPDATQLPPRTRNARMDLNFNISAEATMPIRRAMAKFRLITIVV